MSRCEKCRYAKTVIAYHNWSFIGCHHKPYKGKWVAEIKDCPKYTPFRNYCVYNAPHEVFEYLVKHGLAELYIRQDENYIPKTQYYYSLTKEGTDLLGRILGIKILEESE